MQRLLGLLTDGNSRTIEQLAGELGTTVSDISRRLEYLEHMGVIRKVSFLQTAKCGGSCGGCKSGECAAACKGCIPGNAQMNMGDIWEVVQGKG